MILSSEELEVLAYLKSWKGKYVAMIEICRCAAGRHKYRENPNWAKPLMARLVDSKLVTVNERGHYLWVEETTAPASPGRFTLPASKPAKTGVIIGDDYFPAVAESAEPAAAAPTPAAPAQAKSARWVSPQIAAILKSSGKKVGGHQHS